MRAVRVLLLLAGAGGLIAYHVAQQRYAVAAIDAGVLILFLLKPKWNQVFPFLQSYILLMLVGFLAKALEHDFVLAFHSLSRPQASGLAFISAIVLCTVTAWNVKQWYLMAPHQEPQYFGIIALDSILGVGGLAALLYGLANADIPLLALFFTGATSVFIAIATMAAAWIHAGKG